MDTALAQGQWRLRQLVKLEQSQPVLVHDALERLLAQDDSLRWSLVISAYLDEEVSLARAASLLDLHPLELREQLIEKGVPLLLGPEDEADAQAEVDSIRSWRRTAKP